MNSFWISFLILLGSLTCLAHEPQEGRVYGTFGPFVHQTQSNFVNDTDNNPPGLGFGFLAEGDLSTYGGLEIGVFYLDKIYQRSLGAGHIVEQTYKVAVPIGYRYWFQKKFSAGLAFSTSYSMGPFSVKYNNSGNYTDFTSARDGTEYDVQGSLQWEVWSGEVLSVILDGRYDFALSPKPNEDINEFGLLMAVKYLVHEK